MDKGGGWRALFRGNAVNVMRSAPSKALDFFAFDLFKRLLGDSGSYLQTFAAAGMAGKHLRTDKKQLSFMRHDIHIPKQPIATYIAKQHQS